LNDVFEKEFLQNDINKSILITQNNIGKRQGFSMNIYDPINE